MQTQQTQCAECGSIWREGESCTDHFQQMLYWEFERPEIGIVHHYMVLCYHMQHPSLYSPETLAGSKQMLADFLAGVTPQQMRQQIGDRVDSGKRKFKITGTPDSHGAYAHPVQWTMMAADVVARGIDAYIDSVNEWARSVYACLQTSQNI